MFKLLYIFLYKYTGFIHLPNSRYLNLKFIGSAHTDTYFNISNINFTELQHFKKKKLIFLKKRFFFFKFLSRPIVLLKNLLKRYRHLNNGFIENKDKKTLTYSRVLKRCFTTIRTRRPIKNLYYKISRSRPLIRSFGNEFRSNKNISNFIKNADKLNYSSGLLGKTNIVVLKKNPFIDIHTSDFYFILKNLMVSGKMFSWRTFLKVSKTKRLRKRKPKSRFRVKYRRSIPFFWYTFQSNRFNRLYSSYKNKGTIFMYFIWYNITNFVSRLYSINTGTKVNIYTEPTLLHSNLTGVTLKHTNSVFNNTNKLKSDGNLCIYDSNLLPLSTVSLYNIRTYNWLITI